MPGKRGWGQVFLKEAKGIKHPKRKLDRFKKREKSAAAKFFQCVRV